ncbi:hypothetical protein H4R33_000481 [Dimargaris cristalligena]|nr:hypothetical protein H4R33_000481 [Dimargaris cristalligena]
MSFGPTLECFDDISLNLNHSDISLELDILSDGDQNLTFEEAFPLPSDHETVPDDQRVGQRTTPFVHRIASAPVVPPKQPITSKPLTRAETYLESSRNPSLELPESHSDEVDTTGPWHSARQMKTHRASFLE